jgi:hypothetical protein
MHLYVLYGSPNKQRLFPYTAQKQPENVEHHNCLGSLITNDARYTQKSNRGFPRQENLSSRKSGHQENGLTFKEDTSKVLHLELKLEHFEN